MGKISFKKEVSSPTPDPVAAVVEQVQGAGAATSVGAGPAPGAVAVREEVAPPAPSSPTAGDEDIGIKDIVFPHLNIAQRVGEMGEKFPPGSLVLDGSLQLPATIRLVVLGFFPKAFVEKVEGGGRGQICYSEQEVVDAGGTLDWNEAKETEKPLFQRLAKALLFVEQPEGIAPEPFPYEFGGKNYSFATLNMKGSSYNKGAKILFTQRKVGQLRDDSKGGYRARFWTLGTATEKFQNNTYYVPSFKLAEATTPDFREFVTGIVGF